MNLSIIQSKDFTFTYLHVLIPAHYLPFQRCKDTHFSQYVRINHKQFHNPLVRRGAVDMTALRGRILAARLSDGLLLTGVVVLADFFLLGCALLAGLVATGFLPVGGGASSATGSVAAGLS